MALIDNTDIPSTRAVAGAKDRQERRDMAGAEPKPRLIHTLIGRLLARYIRLVGTSSHQTREMTERFEEHAHHHPCVITMWHGQFLLLPLVRQPGYDVDIMLARHRDAELMGAVLQQFGMRLIRGAGAGGRRKDRGGVHAFRSAVQALREGRSVGMTADVPGSGQARRAGLGVVMVARASGKPVMPFAIATSRYLALNTWSRMTINLPWSNLGFAVGEVVHVPRDASSGDLEFYREAVERSLNAATALAYARAGTDPARATPGFVAPPGLRLRAYRTLTSLARPLAPVILRLRRRQGKEDPSRLPERLGRPSVPRPAGRLVWFHAASVGETLSILPLMAALAEARPSYAFLLTTGTVTSAKLAAQRLQPGALHQYAPLDVPQYVRAFLDHWRPDLAVFTESEIWPNLVLESSTRSIPLTLVNARMTARSYTRWRRNRGVSRPLFGRFSLVLAQNEVLARRFKTLGATATVACGNLKIDTPPPPVDVSELERLKAALEGRPLLVAACTHDGEEEIIADAHSQLRERFPDLVTIIAPRHPERGPAVAQLLEEKGIRTARRTLGELPTRARQAYVLDTLGELGTLYKLAPFAFIGGSLVDLGGHNAIEAVRHGAGVITGPHWQNFADTYKALVGRDAAIVVHSASELADAAGRLLGNDGELARMRARAEAALAGLSGALPRTVEALLRYLPGEDELARAT
jgi:3-deoxy-D-manno-octulosonic-acid transferase